MFNFSSKYYPYFPTISVFLKFSPANISLVYLNILKSNTISGYRQHNNGSNGSDKHWDNQRNVSSLNSNGIPTCVDSNNDGFSTRRKTYKTAREEFFKDLMSNDSFSSNQTSYDEFKRSIAENNLDPVKYIPKIRVSGKTVPTMVQNSGSGKTFAGSLASLSDTRKTNELQQRHGKSSTFRNIIENITSFEPNTTSIPSNRLSCDSPLQANSSYGSLKRRKELKTAIFKA